MGTQTQTWANAPLACLVVCYEYLRNHSLSHVTGIPTLLVAQVEVLCKSSKDVSDAVCALHNVQLIRSG